jgi:hypothetical protein
MNPRKRDGATHWWNDRPITDEHEALYVLVKEWRGPDPVYLSTKREKPEICQELHRQGEGGRESSYYIEYLEIDEELAKKLIKEQWVTPMRILHMGYTETVREKLVLSPHGLDHLKRLTQQKCALAKTLPVPGEHTQFSSILEETGCGCENGRRGGRFYVDLKTPMDERLRVYPDSKQITKLKPKPLEALPSR